MIGAGELLDWYDATGRELPWRGERDPYRIWLSEVMLQQTRVETAAPYYERFLARFPDVDALAAAELDEVLALWSGLGYYRRARHLHRAALQVAAAGGRFPRTAAGLAELPGIGPYTAAAIASIAFDEAVPVLDGNVARVTARLVALDADPGSAAARRRLLAAAAELLDPARPGDSNQALMELGATLCSRRAPRCGECPLERRCAAAAAGEPERYPRPRRRRATERHGRLAVVVRDGERVLLFRRGAGAALLAGLWEPPWVELPAGDAAGRRAASRALAERYGGRWRLGPRLGRVRHGITHRDLHVEVRAGRLERAGGVAEGETAGWFAAGEIAGLPLSALTRKVLAAARGDQDGGEAPAGC